MLVAQNDPSERVNLATMPEYEADVGRLGALLAGYEACEFHLLLPSNSSFLTTVCKSADVDGNMTAEELQPYECVEDPTEWWHNYAGPCCRRKGEA